ncbi:hypothetical protein [Streptomyces pseudovenezuelae]|uniref:hypothetical protein n=1 Tax=Streptomyces pseudovenezuelae TaxID=67350 RepID=UPI002E81F035|nr:hypothetical protein [Streptomyces pseudovenezuelae]WUA94472.1 hypothetical protein OHO81_44665 [Streptomyces pseudovenezuelae]
MATKHSHGPNFGRHVDNCPRCIELAGGAAPVDAYSRRTEAPKTTAHTCGGPVFGKKTPGCPRCDELIAGAEPVRWAGQEMRRGLTRGYGSERANTGGYPTRREIHDHFAPGSPHHRGACGPVCTFGDW